MMDLFLRLLGDGFAKRAFFPRGSEGASLGSKSFFFSKKMLIVLF